MSRLTDDELFKELNRTERSMHAREETLKKLQKRIGQNRRHIFPIFMSGIITAAAVIFLAFFLLDGNLEPSVQQGAANNGVEQLIFEGSASEWFAEYEVTKRKVDGEQQESMRYILTYRGFEFPVNVDYEIQLPDGSVESGSDVPFGIGKTITGSGTCKCTLSSGEEPIKVSVSRKGTTETVELTEKLLIPLLLSGTGASWSFTYEPGGFGEEDEFVINYIGEGPPPNTIDYEIKGKISEAGGTGYSLTEGQLAQRGEIQTLEIYREDQEVEISIKWDGQSESFIASPE